MRWRVLRNKTAALTDREPVGVGKESITFYIDGADGYTVIFKRGEYTLYKKIVDGRCLIPPAAFIPGTVTEVYISNLDGSTSIVCEALKCRDVGGAVFLFPDDGDIPKRVSSLLLAYDELLTEFREIKEKFNEILKRMDELEGLDVY